MNPKLNIDLLNSKRGSPALVLALCIELGLVPPETQKSGMGLTGYTANMVSIQFPHLTTDVQAGLLLLDRHKLEYMLARLPLRDREIGMPGYTLTLPGPDGVSFIGQHNDCGLAIALGLLAAHRSGTIKFTPA